MTGHAIHAMMKAGRDLFAARAVCGKDIPAQRLMIPNTATLLAVISCSDCRAALGWPKTMDEQQRRERRRA